MWFLKKNKILVYKYYIFKKGAPILVGGLPTLAAAADFRPKVFLPGMALPALALSLSSQRTIKIYLPPC